MRLRAAALAALCAVAALAGTAAAAPASALRLVQVGTFAAPTFVAAPRHDPHRVFVTEKFGDVRLIRDGVTQPVPFLQVKNVVSKSEQALASIAFAPDYAVSGRFYVDYTKARPGDPEGSVLTVEEYRRSAANPDRADPSSGRVVLSIDHPGESGHNAGQLQFGRDGLLYVSTGDGGGNQLDPENHAQNTRSLLGKILRIDPRPAAGAAYAIPHGNPFASGAGGAPEVFSYGLRNPWRFSFDRGGSGRMAIADVGQSAREEIDLETPAKAAGADFGWHCREGNVRTPNVPRCKPAGTYRSPFLTYSHTNGRCAVVGAYVVRDHALGSLYGRLLFGDFCDGRLRSTRVGKKRRAHDPAAGLTVDGLESFGEDSCGHLYAASGHGPVYRIDAPASTPCGSP